MNNKASTFIVLFLLVLVSGNAFAAQQQGAEILDFHVQPGSVKVGEKANLVLKVRTYKTQLNSYCGSTSFSWKISEQAFGPITNGVKTLGSSEVNDYDLSYNLPALTEAEVGQVVYDVVIECNTTLAWNITTTSAYLNVLGGKGGDTYACISGGKYACSKSGNSCADAENCDPNSACLSIPKGQCGRSAGALIYGCLAKDGVYACSPGNISDCSDVASCAGSCSQLTSNICGTKAGSVTGKPGQNISVGLNLTNPWPNVNSIFDVINKFTNFLLYLAVPLAVIFIIYAGIILLTSAGNTSKVTQARSMLWYTVIGFAVLLIGKGFFLLIESILNLGK